MGNVKQEIIPRTLIATLNTEVQPTKTDNQLTAAAITLVDTQPPSKPEKMSEIMSLQTSNYAYAVYDIILFIS
jgi:hypothetical protein